MKKFKSKKEDFICEKCGINVVGDGYTNHCPECFWSKHVDINPGDRASECSGLMELVAVEGGVAEYILVHKCLLCDHIKRNKLSKKDNFSNLVKLVEKLAQKQADKDKGIGTTFVKS
ncbi:MAG: RNHCP domain-containing protein [Candidatus Pacebacteria bacterium]|nr:RNHCP domain-containing protein [Candidatus Paceibacterota bacterium]